MSASHAIDSRRDGIWFTDWLLRNCFSDVEIAWRLGVSTQTIWRWRRSKQNLRRAIVLALEAIEQNAGG